MSQTPTTCTSAAEISETKSPGGARTIKIVFDLKLKRPACVLLQAVYGCVEAQRYVHQIDARLWLVSRTPDMKTYAMPIAQAETLARDCEAYHRAMEISAWRSMGH